MPSCAGPSILVHAFVLGLFGLVNGSEAFLEMLQTGVVETSSGLPGMQFYAKLRNQFPEVPWNAVAWYQWNTSLLIEESCMQRLTGLPTASGVIREPRLWGLSAHSGAIANLIPDHLLPLGSNVRVYTNGFYCGYHAGPGVQCGDLPGLPSDMYNYLKNPVKTIEDVHSYEQRVLQAAEETQDFEDADVVLCPFPAALCSTFVEGMSVHFNGLLNTYGNKHLVLTLAWRFDGQRQDAAACAWVAQFSEILRARPSHLVVAHVPYDVAYAHHFTGLGHRIQLIEYTSATWLNAAESVPKVAQHENPTVLLLPDRRKVPTDPDQTLQRIIRRVLKQHTIGAETARELYGSYSPSQVIRHRAAVAVPYSAWSFQLVDWYWLGMTLFVPTPQLLAHMHYWTGVVYELIENCVGGESHGPCKSCYVPGWNASASGHEWPPSDMAVHPQAAAYWFRLFWIYNVPYIKYFSGVWELADRLVRFSAADARRVGQLIRKRNTRVLKKTRKQWHAVLSAMLVS